jgi:hypothetical protein
MGQEALPDGVRSISQCQRRRDKNDYVLPAAMALPHLGQSD